MMIADIEGKRFDRLIPISLSYSDGSYIWWLCRCDCGNEKSIRQDHIIRGERRSCGCLALERITKHGQSGKRIHKIWNGMKQRCMNPKNPRYEDYGGRGIRVCAAWMTFKQFYSDMGDAPQGYFLDRIDNDGNYSKANCKWSTRLEQQNNMRANVRIEYGGKDLTMAQWARELSINSSTLRKRISRGWTIERAFQEVV